MANNGRTHDSHKRRLRSQLWFDNPDNPGMTALYLERYLNYGLTRAELTSGRPIIGIAQTGSDLQPVQSPSSRTRRSACAKAFATPAASPWNFRCIRFRKPASGRPRRSTAISLISAWSKCCTAIRSTAWC